MDVDWSGTVGLRGNGTHDPLILVGFAPQSLLHPPEPGLSLDRPVAPLFSAATGGESRFRILFSIGIDAGPLRLIEGADPDENGHYTMRASGDSGVPLFDIGFDVTTTTGVPAPGTWVGFNPQPEPPASPLHPPDPGYIGFDFTYTSLSTAYLSLQVTEVGGRAVSFTLIPEPAALVLFATGIALTITGRQRGRPLMRRSVAS